MRGKGVSINDFSKLSGISRPTLLHYDRISLLSPSSRGENNYRYYSVGQRTVINLIRTMQDLGRTLDEIKDIRDKRTPEQSRELFIKLLGEIDHKIIDWFRSRQLLFDLLNSVSSALGVDENAVTIQSLPDEKIVLGGINDYSKGKNDFDALLSFYDSLSEKYLDWNGPVWGVFSENRIRQEDWQWPDRYYFYHPEGRDKRPAGDYAIGYARGFYGQTDELYKRLLDHIEQNKFEICGDAYEEYPLNEVSVADDSNYLIRLMIPVRKKKSKK